MFSKKKQSIRWENVKSVDYKASSISFQKDNGEKELFSLPGITFLSRKYIKKNIGDIAKEKNIELNPSRFV
ncbi:MAG: hypothetical protein LBS52_01180 [Dysgonamonadaceae bacterium]|nr:hypothetical protein [Dysgonamonadaceae bacterium]